MFGNGKTALKVNVGRYLAAADGSSITGSQTNRSTASPPQAVNGRGLMRMGILAVDCNLTISRRRTFALGRRLCGRAI
jgi:hypothetical protein